MRSDVASLFTAEIKTPRAAVGRLGKAGGGRAETNGLATPLHDYFTTWLWVGLQELKRYMGFYLGICFSVLLGNDV